VKKYEGIHERSYELDPRVKAVYETTHRTTPFYPTEKVDRLMLGLLIFIAPVVHVH